MNNPRPTTPADTLPGCPPPFWLESACAGEPTRPELTAHFSTCEKCGLELARLKLAHQAFQDVHPPAIFRNRVIARSRSPVGIRRWRWMFALAPVAVTSLALGTYLLPTSAVHLKGSGEAFQVFYKRKGDPQVFARGNHLRTGDALRFSYAAAGDGYLMILDVDGGGRVQALYPYGAADAAPVHTKDSPLLPGSVALDGAPGPERLFAVYRNSPFTFDAVARELLPAGTSTPKVHCTDCRVDEIQIEKEP
jgi:hypothetical protein